EGQFREDLYYRMLALYIDLPPLRKRGNDVDILTKYFIRKYCEKMSKPLLQISEDALNCIRKYNWPGNVRQLENAIIYAVRIEDGLVIQKESLPAYVCESFPASITLDNLSQDSEKTFCLSEIGFSLKDWEKTLMGVALESSKNNVVLAAELLGLSKTTMYRKLKEYNIDVK
ncbi:MAG: helix-turn-helix domain-containing protein, partial [Eubacteriales bacterium]